MLQHVDQWNHNTHFHRYLLRCIPLSAQSALDVGCGLGSFARKLAQRAVKVDAIDANPTIVAEAKSHYSAVNIHYTHADFITSDMPLESYDIISAIASIHHMDMTRALRKMKALLRPSGTLVILGLYQERTLLDHIYSWVSVPVNYVYLLRHRASASAHTITAPTCRAQLTLRQIKDVANDVIPGYSLKRHLLWRYSLVWRKL